MRLVLVILSIAVAVAGLVSKPPEEPEAVLIFTGDIKGYLSPCGCTKPQMGGLKRLAAAVRALRMQPNTFYVDLGNWTKAAGRQDELKAEAIAEVFSSLKPDYLNIGPMDAKLGGAYLESLREAVGGKMFSSNFAGRWYSARVRLGERLFVQGFMSDSEAERYGELRVAMNEAVLEAPSGGRLVVLLAAGRESAEALARERPEIDLIIYSNPGDPTRLPLRMGKTLLVSPGDKGRFVGKIELVGGEWKNLAVIDLGPEIKDDKRAHDAYWSYLQRVSAEDLIGRIKRTEQGEFVGSEACASCHSDAYEIWKRSKHATALATLEASGNDRDPECVGCHVVGLDATRGFRDRKTTPLLSDVGCESCHGAGGRHVQSPLEPYGKAGEKACLSCHNKDHSPGFVFGDYWKLIEH